LNWERGLQIPKRNEKEGLGGRQRGGAPKGGTQKPDAKETSGYGRGGRGGGRKKAPPRRQPRNVKITASKKSEREDGVKPTGFDRLLRWIADRKRVKKKC